MDCTLESLASIAAPTTLTLVRGDDQDVGLSITDVDGITPYNLSGSLLTFTARYPNTWSAGIILQKLVTGGASNVSGTATLSFTSGETAPLDQSPYFYDLKLFTTGLKTKTLSYGTLAFLPG